MAGRAFARASVFPPGKTLAQPNSFRRSKCKIGVPQTAVAGWGKARRRCVLWVLFSCPPKHSWLFLSWTNDLFAFRPCQWQVVLLHVQAFSRQGKPWRSRIHFGGANVKSGSPRRLLPAREKTAAVKQRRFLACFTPSLPLRGRWICPQGKDGGSMLTSIKLPQRGSLRF